MTPCVHCDDTGFCGTDAYGERVRCGACVPTAGVTTTPGPKPAGWDAIADGNTRAVEEMMAGRGQPPPNEAVTMRAGDPVVASGPWVTANEARDRAKMDAVRAALSASRTGPIQVIAEPEPEQPHYAPWVKLGQSEIQHGPFAVVVRPTGPITAPQAEIVRAKIEREFKARGAAVPPVLVADGMEIQMPAAPPAAEWYHLPGRSIRVAAVTQVSWQGWLALVHYAGTETPTVLDAEQAAALRALVGAPDPAPGGAAG